MARYWFVLFPFLFIPAILFAEICSWVDESGVRHYSNTGDCPEIAGESKPEVAEGDVTADQNSSGLKFRGVYRDGINYLRFYADGTVVSVTTSGKPDQLASWFGRTGKNIHQGEYKMSRDNTIRIFTAHKEFGVVLCKGKVYENELQVVIYRIDKSHIDERYYPKLGIGEYTFFPVAFAQGNTWKD